MGKSPKIKVVTSPVEEAPVQYIAVPADLFGSLCELVATSCSFSVASPLLNRVRDEAKVANLKLTEEAKA